MHYPVSVTASYIFYDAPRCGGGGGERGGGEEVGGGGTRKRAAEWCGPHGGRKKRAGGLAKPIAANLHRLQQLSRAERRSKRGSLAAREASGTPKYGLRWVSAMGGARGRVSSRTEVAVGPSKGMGQSNVCHPHVGMCRVAKSARAKAEFDRIFIA